MGYTVRRDEFECPACGHIFTADLDGEVTCPACDAIMDYDEEETPPAPDQTASVRDEV